MITQIIFEPALRWLIAPVALLAIIVGCDRGRISTSDNIRASSDSVLQDVWTPTTIKWKTDTVPDGASYFTSTYAGVRSLYFAPDHRFKILDFLAYRGLPDTVHAGAEPSRALYLGTWKRAGSSVIVSYRLEYRDIHIVGQKEPGNIVVDTIKIVVDKMSNLMLSFKGDLYERTRSLDSVTRAEVVWLDEK